MVGAGRVLAGGNDGEVHLVVAFVDDPATQVGRHLRFGPPDQFDLAALQLAGDPSTAAPAAASASISA